MRAIFIRNWGAVLIACAITLYFFRQNLVGIHESSGKALKIMVATTVMGVVILVWCGVTLPVRGPVNRVPLAPDLSPKVEYQVVAGTDRVTGEKREIWQRDPTADSSCRRWKTAGAVARSSTRPPASQEDPLGFMQLLSLAGRAGCGSRATG